MSDAPKRIPFSKGSSSPLGLTRTSSGWNLAVFSAHAKEVFLGLFTEEGSKPFASIPMEKSGDVWCIQIEEAPPNTCYAYLCKGAWDPDKGDLFNPEVWLLDPYAKIINSSKKWGEKKEGPLTAYFLELPPRTSTKRPSLPKQDLLIYEMHTRGFTAHPSSEVTAPGTYAGIVEKIPYLKELGVNAIELMPIFEFDECGCRDIHPYTGEKLLNYWGYDPLSFFSPKRNFAHDVRPGGAILELRQLADTLHENGMELFLDVVYNHTAEGGDLKKSLSWRGIDHRSYYLLDSKGKLLDYTGCGNTFNANHPIAVQMIVESLCYWVEEIGVDGFRFDLASVLTRGIDGKPMKHPPVLEALQKEARLAHVKWIAEAWDATGLYQVGAFPQWGPWSEWNGRYRDIVRRFLKGTDGKAGKFAAALTGSDFLYGAFSPTSSINFFAAHDGFSLRDLVTYQSKHNWENGEINRDGASQNDNWNCGIEGPTSNLEVQELRERQMRNFWLALLLAQGIPMILMGDEYGHTRRGNNNPYVQDNELNWFLWSQWKAQKPIFDFVKSWIAFRKKEPRFQRDRFLKEADIAWHGTTPHQPDWSESSRFCAFTIRGAPPIYVAFNADYREREIELPREGKWHLLVDTQRDWAEHWLDKPDAPPLPSKVKLLPYSALVAILK
jgi:isoamylase